MKIDYTPLPIDREPALKTAPRGDDAHREQGRAFDAAIRDAKPAAKEAPKPEAAPRADTPAKAPSAPAAKGETPAGEPAASKAKAKADVGAEADKDDAKGADPEVGDDLRPLQALLGILTQGSVAGAADKAAQPDETKLVRTLVPEEEAKAGSSEAAEALSGGKSVRLDVLKMETHFEPHQDGMVLVRSDAERKAGESDGADLKAEAKAKASDTAAVLAGLAGTKAARLAAEASASNERLAAASAQSAGDAAATGKAGRDGPQADTAGLPLRFDEALARLSGRDGAGQGAGEGRGENRGERRGDTERAIAADAGAAVKTAAVDGTTGTGAGGAGGFGLATQIADRMLEVLGEPAPRPAASASQDTQEHLRMRAGGAALKTLTIQLKPEHLGTLDVSMRLSEGRLTVELAASRADTAVLLSEDRGALRQLLERAGFSVDDAAITVVAKDIQPNAVRSSDSSASTGGDPSGSGSTSGQAARDESSAREGERQSRRPPEPANAPARREDTPARGRSSTYL